MPRTPLTPEEKAERAQARKDAKRERERIARIEAQKAQRPVASMNIEIEWRKSRMYGSTPIATAKVLYADGSYTRSKEYKAGGCGYDKESTVVGEIFTDYLAYMLHRPEDWVREGVRFMRGDTKPYGIYFYDGVGCYAGGIGISCYYDIAKFIGGKLEHLANNRTFDVYSVTFPQPEGAKL